MSWHFLQGQEEAFWEGGSLDGAPSALLKLMPIAGEFSLHGNATAPLTHSQSGTISGRLTQGLGEDSLMSSVAGSPARTSAQQVRALELKASGAGFGWRWPGSFARWDPSSSLWRTRQCSLLEGLDEFSEIWPRWGSMLDGECLALAMPEHLTNVNEFGFSLPTPTASDYGSNQSLGANASVRPSLQQIARKNLWATPNKKGASPTSGDGLATQAGGPLNPTWVEWLMGWPLEWTGLGPLEMGKFQQWLNWHGRL